MDEKLLFKYFRGETTSDEEDAILAWVEETPANRKEFKTAFMIFSGLAVYAAKPNAMPTAAPQRRRIWRQVVRYSLRSAAAVILMIGAAYTGKTLYRNALSQQNMSIVVPAGQQMSLTLPDNSQVQFNSGTRLEYPVVFLVDVNEGIVPPVRRCSMLHRTGSIRSLSRPSRRISGYSERNSTCWPMPSVVNLPPR